MAGTLGRDVKVYPCEDPPEHTFRLLGPHCRTTSLTSNISFVPSQFLRWTISLSFLPLSLCICLSSAFPWKYMQRMYALILMAVNGSFIYRIKYYICDWHGRCNLIWDIPMVPCFSFLCWICFHFFFLYVSFFFICPNQSILINYSWLSKFLHLWLLFCLLCQTTSFFEFILPVFFQTYSIVSIPWTLSSGSSL